MCNSIQCYWFNFVQSSGTPDSGLPRELYSRRRSRIRLLFTTLFGFQKIQTTRLGYTLVRPFLYFDLSTSKSLLRLAYFDSFTSTSVFRPFVKSGILTGREVWVEVQFWSK